MDSCFIEQIKEIHCRKLNLLATGKKAVQHLNMCVLNINSTEHIYKCVSNWGVWRYRIESTTRARGLPGWSGPNTSTGHRDGTQPTGGCIVYIYGPRWWREGSLSRSGAFFSCAINFTWTILTGWKISKGTREEGLFWSFRWNFGEMPNPRDRLPSFQKGPQSSCIPPRYFHTAASLHLSLLYTLRFFTHLKLLKTDLSLIISCVWIVKC